MTIEQTVVRTNPNKQLFAAEADARLQELRRINKMKSVCSSHQTAGSALTPHDSHKEHGK